MHISDGFGVPEQLLAGAGVASAALAGGLLARMDSDRVPRVALCTAFFFVASLVHVPVGPTSVHLLLVGLVGIIAGPWAFLPVAFGLVLQALLFQHGGITTLGVNAVVMGLPAYAAWGVFRLGRRLPFGWSTVLSGFLAGWLAVGCASVLLALFLASAGESFRGVAVAALLAHQPVALIEGVVTASAAGLIEKVEPEMLGSAHA